MGADADKKKGYTLYGLRITPATVVGSISFLTVTALLLQERSYRRRIEHEDAVDRGICEAQVRVVPPTCWIGLSKVRHDGLLERDVLFAIWLTTCHHLRIANLLPPTAGVQAAARGRS